MCQVEENVKKKNDSDSDSSSLPSLDEEKKSNPEKNKNVKRKKKTKQTDEKNRGPKVSSSLMQEISTRMFMLSDFFEIYDGKMTKEGAAVLL